MLFQYSPTVAALLIIGLAGPGYSDEDPYRQAMARCEQAKRERDFLAMAAAIREALRHGPGDEYAWRSLAWAFERSGQWEDSVRVAQENVRRNGVCGWSLEQLAESQISAGDFPGAQQTLAQIETLPTEAIGPAREAIEGTQRRLMDLTGQRRYWLRWQVDLGQGGPSHQPARLLMPRWNDPRQTFRFRLTNVVSYRSISDGPRDFIEVIQKPGEPFEIYALVTIRAFALGYAPLARADGFIVPKELEKCLMPFRHGEIFDPASPLCSRIAGMCGSASMSRTVQNLLDWMHLHMKYADTKNRTLDAILAGGEGVCHHQCAVFTALCRAAGVPARVAHGVVLESEGKFTDNRGSHGWASVYIHGLGWVPVDPLDRTSLAFFGRSNYLLTDYANETPADHHFDYTSIQGFPCDGAVVAIEPQATNA